MVKILLKRMDCWATKPSPLLFRQQDWEIVKQFSLPRSMELIIAKSLLVLVFLEEPLMDIGLPAEEVIEEETGVQTLTVP